jgi:hypothetical protein
MLPDEPPSSNARRVPLSAAFLLGLAVAAVLFALAAFLAT